MSAPGMFVAKVAVATSALIALSVVAYDVMAEISRHTPTNLGQYLPAGMIQDEVVGFAILTEADTDALPASRIRTVFEYQHFDTPQLVHQRCYVTGSNKPNTRAHLLLAEKDGRGVVTEFPLTADDADQFGVTLGTLSLAIGRCKWMEASR